MLDSSRILTVEASAVPLRAIWHGPDTLVRICRLGTLDRVTTLGAEYAGYNHTYPQSEAEANEIIEAYFDTACENMQRTKERNRVSQSTPQ